MPTTQVAQREQQRTDTVRGKVARTTSTDYGPTVPRGQVRGNFGGVKPLKSSAPVPFATK